MIKDDDFLIINEYIEEFRGTLYRIQEGRMRSRYENAGNLYGDTFKFYTKLNNKDIDDLHLSFTKEELWKRRNKLIEKERLYYVNDKRSIINQVIYMWNNLINKDIYPSNLYFKAIIYAKVLSDLNELDFYDLLSDSNLLNNDKDWKNYQEDKETYDEILCSINLDNIYDLDGMSEFYIEECKKEFNL